MARIDQSQPPVEQHINDEHKMEAIPNATPNAQMHNDMHANCTDDNSKEKNKK